MSFDYHVQRTQTEFDKGARRKLNGEQPTEFSSAEDFVNNAPIEDFRLALKKIERSDAEKAAAQQSKLDSEVFVRLHPEWLDTEENAYQLRAHCMAAFGTPHPNLAQMEVASEALKANGLVTLNRVALAKQAASEAQARANKIREEAFNEEVAYALPLEEVKRRANRGW